MVLLKALVVNLPTSQQNNEEKYQLQLDLGTYTHETIFFCQCNKAITNRMKCSTLQTIHQIFVCRCMYLPYLTQFNIISYGRLCAHPKETCDNLIVLKLKNYWSFFQQDWVKCDEKLSLGEPAPTRVPW